MKRSETLSRAIDVLGDVCQQIVNEKRHPFEAQISKLQALRFDPDGEAGRLSLEAATSEDPRACLIKAAQSLQNEDLMNTAGQLRATVVQSIKNKLANMDGDMKAVARLRQIATAVTEQATKALIGVHVGGNPDFVASSVQRHLLANVSAAQGVVESIRGAFHDPRLDKPLQAVSEAFTAMVAMVEEAEAA